MRISEKSIELTYCSQLAAAHYPRKLIWFGLTQKQEAQAGFDACTSLGGRLYLLQFKASCEDVHGARRFHLPHQQMTSLKSRSSSKRSVFYVLPMVGTTLELAKNPDVLSQTWLLDVRSIPAIPPPTTRWGSTRKSAVHYLDLAPPSAVLHSDPVSVEVIPSRDLISRSADAGAVRFDDDWSVDTFTATIAQFRRHAYGLVVLP